MTGSGDGDTSGVEPPDLTVAAPTAPVSVPPPEPVGEGGHVVTSGEGISSIAEATGFFWQTLWNHGDNADLKRARPNPHVLLPGDRVTIPPREEKLHDAQTGRRHRFRRRGVPAQIRFQVRDAEGKPFAGKRYELKVGSLLYEGTTDAEGRILRWVAAAARTGEITVWLATPDYPEVVRYSLQVGHLEPIESTRGVKSRLNGLGFACGEASDEIDAATAEALRAFQRAQGMTETGQLDEATRGKIREAYGM